MGRALASAGGARGPSGEGRAMPNEQVQPRTVRQRENRTESASLGARAWCRSGSTAACYERASVRRMDSLMPPHVSEIR